MEKVVKHAEITMQILSNYKKKSISFSQKINIGEEERQELGSLFKMEAV